ncbi:DegT/DnrJ/EryC1/StrS family aminotransferase [Shewanella aegiceratis]|uniref:DegT/DnrJ/EryC1/StrS aminotransferase family protein n=1 Tax=Shewanella aegiceratis TaxID=2864203 RepID=UPI001C65B520|nr:DegT/DnrJ/EryC1/StrS family aminotransferase [Shewanella aegiceratis]QYJ83751.1 DegT/DnrJ/EryC1/StrS family aminotransferase [Shewanella aegiceratis]
MIALNSPLKPDLNKLQKLLEKVSDSGWYTNFGPLHQELTLKLEDYLGVQNLLLTNNGTSALQVAAKAIGSQSFLITPFSFVATASAFKWQRDEVAFADIDPNSLNLSSLAVDNAYREGCTADTVVATHVYGNPCDVYSMDKLAKKHGFRLLYDAAHAFGINLNSKSVLEYGDASTLSFHATKIFHTVEGGAIVFKDNDIFEKAKEMINFGIKTGVGVVGVGINAKLNEYQAAVGLVNLEGIDDILSHRSELFYSYRKGLEDCVKLPDWHPQANVNGAYMPILLESEEQLKKISNLLCENNIESRHYFSPSLNNVFVDSHDYGSVNSVSASKRVLCLPLHANLSLDEVKKVVKIVREGL